MELRTAKKLLYGFFYFLVASGVCISAYFIFFKPVPSCADGVLNQNEQEIDCDGVCPPCELKTLALSVPYKKFFYSTGGRVSFIVGLENTSPNFWVKEFSYEIDIANRSGLITSVLNGKSSVPPNILKYHNSNMPSNIKKYILLPAAYLNTEGIGGFDFKIVGDPVWEPADTYVYDDFFVPPVTTKFVPPITAKIVNSQANVSGTVVSRAVGDIPQAIIYAIFKNKYGDPVNISSTAVTNLRLSVPTKFEINLPYTKGDDLDPLQTFIIVEPQT